MRRKHHKIAQLPPEIRSAVDDLLSRDETYERVAEFLKGRGYKIGKSSVARYGRDFAARFERIRLVQEQIKTIVDGTGGEPLKLEEGATQVALHHLASALLRMKDLDEVKPVEVIRTLASLQRASTEREKVQIAWRQKAQEAASRIERRLSEAKVGEDLIRAVRTELLGLVA